VAGRATDLPGIERLEGFRDGCVAYLQLAYSNAIQLGIPSLPETFRGLTRSWFLPGCKVQVKLEETVFFSPPSTSARKVSKLGVSVSK
jgi:hypothetical protein